MMLNKTSSKWGLLSVTVADQIQPEYAAQMCEYMKYKLREQH